MSYLMSSTKKIILVLAPLVLFLWFIYAAREKGEVGHTITLTFLEIAAILVLAKIATMITRLGQPAVLGELLMGVVIGNLTLAGINLFEPIKHNEIIKFMSELGVVVLLFQVGLESNIKDMLKVGVNALLVATVGVVAPFILGTWVVGPLFLPGLSFNAYLFLGAALTATSVGITARVFKDLGKLNRPEAKIVLGAAVIDDVMGLVILAAVSAIATVGTVGVLSISWIIVKATLFLVGAIIVGSLAAPGLGALFSKIHEGGGMKFTVAISLALVYAYLAQEIGLAPIVGAFAAGLLLDPVHFKQFQKPKIATELTKYCQAMEPEVKKKIIELSDEHAKHHVEELIEPLGFFLVPIFFVMVGMEVNLEILFNLPILLVALGITVVAFAGKLAAGLVAGKVNKWIVGFGMVPRGEVGLIFAVTGKAMGVVTDAVFSVIVIVIILSTLLIPPVLAHLLKRQKATA